MQVGSSTQQYNIGSSYSIKLNEKEMLVIDEDPLSKSQQKAKIVTQKQEDQDKKAQEAKKSNGPDNLSDDEKRLVRDLGARDSEVKAHESAHQAAGGGMTGAASYTYQQGPDGRMYAIGGEVSISTPSASTPDEAIANARQVMASSMAAGDPSPQDYAVASSARVMEMKAIQQKAKEQTQEGLGKETYASLPQEKDKQEEPEPFNISA